MDFSLITIIGGFFIATFVGFLTGVFGVGGGFLMTPALIIILGVPGATAVGTDLATILTTSSVAMYQRRGSRTIDVKLGLTILIGTVLGVLIGLAILEALKNTPPLVINGREVETIKYVLLCGFVVMLLWIAGFMLWDYFGNQGRSPAKRVGWFAKFHLAPYGHFKTLEEPKLSIVALVLLGMVVGMLTGLLGIGGGVVLLPALIYLVGQRAVKAAGTSLFLVWAASAVAVIQCIRNGNIDYYLWPAMCVGGMIGASVGTRVGLKTADAKLRLYFVYVVIAAIVLILYKVFQMTFGAE